MTNASMAVMHRSNVQVFEVFGTAIPQGSKTASVINGKAILREANPKHKAWRKTVTDALLVQRQQSGYQTFECPVLVVVSFYLPRPKTVTREFPSVKPDLDKLCRSLFDSCSDAGVWLGDQQVVSLHANKQYSDTPKIVLSVVAKISDKDLD